MLNFEERVLKLWVERELNGLKEITNMIYYKVK